MTEQHPTPADTAPQGPRRRTSTRARWIAGIGGLAVATAIAVPAVASAATTAPAQGAPAASCTALDRATARADSAPKVVAYLTAHPDLNDELTKVKAMPKDQRRGELETYFTAHADEKAGLKDARSAVTTLHKSCK